MKIIKDLKGREWKLSITVGSVKRVKSELNLDIYNVANKDFLKAIIEDPIKFIDMLFVLVEDQAEDLDVDDIEFGKSFDGDTIAESVNSFLEELVNFFPPSKRESLKKALAMTMEMTEKAGQEMVKKLDEFDLDKAVDTVMVNMKPIQ